MFQQQALEGLGVYLYNIKSLSSLKSAGHKEEKVLEKYREIRLFWKIWSIRVELSRYIFSDKSNEQNAFLRNILMYKNLAIVHLPLSLKKLLDASKTFTQSETKKPNVAVHLLRDQKFQKKFGPVSSILSQARVVFFVHLCKCKIQRVFIWNRVKISWAGAAISYSGNIHLDWMLLCVCAMLYNKWPCL